MLLCIIVAFVNNPHKTSLASTASTSFAILYRFPIRQRMEFSFLNLDGHTRICLKYDDLISLKQNAMFSVCVSDV